MNATNLPAIMLVGGLAHVALLWASKKVDSLFLIGAAFLVLSPLSAAPDLSILYVAKYGRAYCTVLIIVIGMFGYRREPFGPASKAMFVFLAAYVGSAVWSDLPAQGVLYKSYCAYAIVAGILLAYGLRGRADFVKGFRLLGAVAGFSSVIALAIFLHNPEAGEHQGRIAILGLNSNRIAETAAPLFLICSFVALNERSANWKLMGYSSCGLLAVIILLSGSRAAAAMVVIGFAFQAMPLVKRPGQLLLLAVFVTVISITVLKLADSTESIDRFTSTHNTRAQIWRHELQVMSESPLIGNGWYHTPEMTQANAHSIYLQVALEAGVLGLGVMLVAFAIIIRQGWSCYRLLQRFPNLSGLASLPLSFAVGVMVHGLAEATALGGSTPNSLLLGLGVGLMDRLQESTRPVKVLG